jgi:TPR repeat protein
MKMLRHLLLLLPLLAVFGCKTYKAQPDLVDIRQFKPAAEHGDALAQYRLGQAYASRWKYFEANPWYRKAALQGVPDAMYALGVNCLSGAGVPKDPIAAYAWFDIAATQTHVLAANARQNLADRMTRSEMDDGDRMATEIIAQIPPEKLRYAFVPKTKDQPVAPIQAPAKPTVKKPTPAPAAPAAKKPEAQKKKSAAKPEAAKPAKEKTSSKPSEKTPPPVTKSTASTDELQPAK